MLILFGKDQTKGMGTLRSVSELAWRSGENEIYK